MKRFLTALTLFVAPSLFASESLTLDQAISIAIQNNPTVRNAQLEIEKGGDRLTAARTNRLPSFKMQTFGSEGLNRLSLSFKEGSFGTYPETGPIPNKDTHIEIARSFSMFAVAQIQQPISQLYKINLGIKLNEAALEATREQERAARQAITREVKAAYFTVMKAESAVAAANDAVIAHEEVAREMNVRVSNKIALEADRMDATARLASIKATQLIAQNGLASAKQQLNYILGREIDTDFTIDPRPDSSLASQLGMTATTENRPDIRAAKLQVEQARLDMKIKAADRIPEVSLVLSHTSPMNVESLPRNISSAGVIISYEPFTWGRRGAEITEKRRSVEQAENSLRDKRSAAQLEIATRLRKVAETAADVQVKQLEAEAAKERLRVTRTRFNQKAARPDEMFAASASLTNASAREQEAMSAYWIARADYEKAIGEE